MKSCTKGDLEELSTLTTQLQKSGERKFIAYGRCAKISQNDEISNICLPLGVQFLGTGLELGTFGSRCLLNAIIEIF